MCERGGGRSVGRSSVGRWAVGRSAGAAPKVRTPHNDVGNKYSPNMVYYNMLGIYIIRGVGGFIIRGRGLVFGEFLDLGFLRVQYLSLVEGRGGKGLGFRV